MNTTEKKELTAADLALYIGCDVEWNGVVYRLAGVNIGQYDVVEIGIERNGARIWVECEAVKPILRPLSDITDVEALAWAEFFGAHSGALDEGPITFFRRYYSDYCSAESVRYLLSKHFDLFGWIESGLAIDKTKTK